MPTHTSISAAKPSASGPWVDKTVFLTGASSGIGEALAYELARCGASIGLFARRETRLSEMANRIRRAGGWALPLEGDVTRQEDVDQAVERLIVASGPVDVLIANAGRGIRRQDEMNADVVQDVYSVNFMGAVYALQSVLPSMRERGNGHAAVISSGLALLPGLAASPTYASSKAAVSRYFEGLRRALQSDGISVTMVYPGFVRTEMTAGQKWMPFALEPQPAARIIRRALERQRRRLVFPRRAIWLGRLVSIVPIRYQARVRRR